jgi:hypothetical protein
MSTWSGKCRWSGILALTCLKADPGFDLLAKVALPGGGKAGLWVECKREMRPSEATAMGEAEVVTVQETVRKRVLALFERWGLLTPEAVADMRQWEHGGGFSLDASIRIGPNDRAGLERLLRYCRWNLPRPSKPPPHPRNPLVPQASPRPRGAPAAPRSGRRCWRAFTKSSHWYAPTAATKCASFPSSPAPTPS